MTGMQYIEADLAKHALDEWAAGGLARLEASLLRHAAFDDYLRKNSALREDGPHPNGPA